MCFKKMLWLQKFLSIDFYSADVVELATLEYLKQDYEHDCFHVSNSIP